MTVPISIKGSRDGLLVSLDEAPSTQTALPELLSQIDQNPDFFRGARLTLQVGARALSEAELGELRDQLTQRQVGLWCILSQSATTESAAQELGLLTALPTARARVAAADDPPFDSDVDGAEAVLARRTLRSGHSLRHTGNVVVIGDVNPGAEVVAGGDVVVWGRLRGVVHAGAWGDESAVVCALDLSPTQLRIGNHIATSPERRGKAAPEMARVRDGQLVAERWTPARGET